MRFYDVFSKQFWTGKNTEHVVTSFDNAGQQVEDKQDSTLTLSKDTLEELYNTYGISAFQVYASLAYSQLSQRKAERLKVYRSMGSYPDISDAIDEIADAFYNLDINERFINLEIKNELLSDTRKRILQSEFDKYISYFNFESNMYSYVRTFMTTGELFFENIINKEQPDEGIVGIKEMEPDGFEMLKLPNTFENIGFVYYPRYGELNYNNTGASFGSVPLPTQFLSTIANAALTPNEAVAVPHSQMTYINSNSYDVTKTIVYPVLEKIRKLYNQVTMLEDAAITYRIARSPSRLVFNVSSGNMPRHKAEQEVMKLMRRFETRKAPQNASGSEGSVSNVYENHNAQESYFFLKNGDDGGTEVTNLDASVGFDQMEDVKYFTKRLYNALKIPYSRVSEGDNDGEVARKSDAIGYAEYRFAKFVMRLQNNFSAGLMKGFKVHLALLGLWEKYSLSPVDIKVKWAPPTEYELYNRLKMQQSLLDVYTAYASNDEFSKTYLMKKILNWTKADIDENMFKKIIEKINSSQAEYVAGKVAETGMLTVDESIVKPDRQKMLTQLRTLFIDQSPSNLERDFELAQNDTYAALLTQNPHNEEAENEEDSENSEGDDSENLDDGGAGGGFSTGGGPTGDGADFDEGGEELGGDETGDDEPADSGDPSVDTDEAPEELP